MKRKELLALIKKLEQLGRTGLYVYLSKDGWTLGQTTGTVTVASNGGGDLAYHCVRAF